MNERPQQKNASGSAGASPSRASASPSPPELPIRSHPAHGVFSQINRPTIVFLTVCTKERNPFLADDEVHRLLVDVWKKADAWLVGRYVIMPDHIHLFAARTGSGTPFDNWVRFWKSQFTRGFKNPDHCWQSDHWDRTLRNGDSYEEKWNYVRDNPVRHGLVAHPEDWPFQGELNSLPW